jgi:hypothetical protein
MVDLTGSLAHYRAVPSRGHPGPVAERADHYRLLRTIEDLYHLAALGQAALGQSAANTPTRSCGNPVVHDWVRAAAMVAPGPAGQFTTASTPSSPARGSTPSRFRREVRGRTVSPNASCWRSEPSSSIAPPPPDPRRTAPTDRAGTGRMTSWGVSAAPNWPGSGSVMSSPIRGADPWRPSGLA